ncbi:hypothetical protein [Paractinoplanes ferrugineus]|nr:hypothetical protein [Actinoplanes ferrugineus]
MRSDQTRGVAEVDSPAVRARARARVPVADGDIKFGDRLRQAVTSWWLLTSEPMTLLALWNASKVDRKRVPAGNGVLRALWHVSNWSDRIVMFAVIAVAPTFATGALRWIAVRPTRRYGLYLTLAALTGAYLYGRKH